MIYVPTLSYVLKLCVVAKRMRLWIKAVKISSLGSAFRGRMRSSHIWREYSYCRFALIETAEEVKASDQDALWILHFVGGRPNSQEPLRVVP